MGKLWEILSGPVTGLVQEIGSVIDNLHTSDTEKLKAQQALTEITLAFQLKMAEMDTQVIQAQADVIKTEAQGASWLQRNWRPISMLSFVFVILYAFVVVPTFNLTPVTLPENLWTVVQVGFGGYVFGRSAEKIAPHIADAFKNRKK
jgi:hypothetical protein